MEPADHGEPTERTEVKVLFDDDALYIAVHAFDSEPGKIRATQLAQGKSVHADDMLQIILDPFLNRRTGYTFFINPNGIRREGLYESPSKMNKDWRGIWQGEARIVADGWTAEIRIPFKTINFDPALDDWGFTVGRSIKRKQERLAWTSLNRRSDPSNTGVISGIKGVDQGVGLDIIPSIAFKAKHTNASDTTGFDAVPSIDLFYKLTPSLTTVLTLNTDFSATDVDNVVVNLSRFDVLFPEKRAFFLQDSDIFAFSNIKDNGIPFFSRQIGLSEDGNPVDILAGIKATGRVGRWNLGFLDVLQDEHPGVEQSNLLVARATANILAESNVGFILTHGDPQSDEDNSLVGADFGYRNTQAIKGKALEGSLWFQMTDTESLEDDNTAFGGNIGLFARSGFMGQFRFRRIEENYNPALGFENRTGIDQAAIWTEYAFRPQGSKIRKLTPGLFFYNVYDNDGLLLSKFRSLQPFEIETQSGDKIRLRLRRREELFQGDYEISPGVIIPTGNHTFAYQELWFETSSSRPVSAKGTFTFGDYFDGRKNGFSGDLQWRPNKHIFLSAGLDYNNVKLAGGNFITRLVTAKFDVAVNSRWSVLNFVQYDNVSDSAALNSRLRWTPKSGREMFLVLNYGADIDDEGTIRSRETEFVAKVGHTFRF